MTNIKPTPPIQVQELLKLLGFYTEGFCTGHCEHAPLRELNPELNAAIEAWHDTHYSNPTIDDNNVDISDYLTGEPGSDWRAVAFDLVNAIQSYDPEALLDKASVDGKVTGSAFVNQFNEWLLKTIIPALSRFYSVEAEYSNIQLKVADPF